MPKFSINSRDPSGLLVGGKGKLIDHSIDNKLTKRKVAEDHLIEIQSYYTLLISMEKAHINDKSHFSIDSEKYKWINEILDKNKQDLQNIVLFLRGILSIYYMNDTMRIDINNKLSHYDKILKEKDPQ
jgi:hypothetical protein